ncbi:MAG: helix-turn-helix domain-containing protein, partial [Haloechinothrix sp.]
MAATTPLTDAERRKIARLHAAGHSCSRIAKELRRSRSTISNTARKLGLKFDRAKTAAATQANVIDAKARRAQLA